MLRILLSLFVLVILLLSESFADTSIDQVAETCNADAGSGECAISSPIVEAEAPG